MLNGGEDKYEEGGVYFVPADLPDSYDGGIVNTNTNSVPDFFPDVNGRPSPQLVYLVPTTIDGVSPDNRAIFDGSKATGCVNVSQEAVRVAFLNAITIEELTTDDCSGSFTVRGGVSEFRESTDYTISVRNTDNGELAELQFEPTSYRSGELVNYTVDSPGDYEIFIEDGISCEGMTSVTHTACAAVEPSADCTADAGELANFTNVRLQSNSLGNVAQGGTAAYGGPTDTVFLCLGDEFTINLIEDSWNLDFDPDPNTPNGIAYALYERIPTVSGPGPFEAFEADPSNFDQAPFDGSITYTPPTDFAGGDYSIRVEHVEPPFTTEIFADANGNPQPVVIAIAPITLSGRDAQGDALIEEYTNSQGELVNDCIAVSTDQTVQVGFLNPIEAEVAGGGCEGNFTVTGGVSELRGTGSYTINITNAATGAQITLPRGATGYGHGDVVEYSVEAAGTYNLTVEDQVSCGFETSFAVTDVCNVTTPPPPPPPPADDLAFTPTTQPVTCSGDNDGALVITITGGEGPYTITYRRTNPAPTAATNVTTPSAGDFTIPDLRTGFYEVTVADNTGATAATQRDIQIEEGNPFDADIITLPGSDCNANAQVTLAAVVIVEGDTIDNPTTSGYTILWSTGASTETISATPNQNYGVTVTSTASGCEQPDSETPTQASTLVIDINRSPTAAATCSGSLDGTVTVQVSGGVPGNDGQFQYDWSDGISLRGGRTAQRGSLNPGNYTVTVTDLNGCSDTRTFTIAAEKTLVANLDSTQVECFGESNGTIIVNASTVGPGAAPPYRASLEDTLGIQLVTQRQLTGNTTTFDGLAAGTYVVVLQDSDPQQCETRDTIEVTQPEELALAVTTTSPICPEDPDGTALLVVSGGTGPYTYRIINDSLPAPTALDSLATFDTLLVDTNGIEDLQSSPYYFAIIDDVNGCGPDSLQFEIKPRPQPNVTNALITTISCPGDSDGQLSAIATPPPGDSISITDYAWYRLLPDNSQGEQVAVGRTTQPNLTVGAYILEITLSNGCKWPFLGIVDSPGLVEYASDSITSPTCLGDSDGSILLSVTGGTPNPDGTYNYSWSDLDAPITDNARTGLSAGTYGVTVTDANNCQPPFDTSFVLTDPVGITGDFTVVENVSCPNDTTADGRVIFSAGLSDGSIGTFDFYWSTGDTILGVASSSQMNLPRGPISVTVTDGICPQVFDTIISSPDEFAFDPRITPATCNGDTTGAAEILVTGGTPGYTFSYVDRPEVTNRLNNVEAGLYQLLVTDANGCQADTFSFVIEQPDSLVLTIDPFVTTPRVTCFGDEDGVLAVQLVSNNNNPLGDSPYTWSPAVAEGNETSATDLAPGTYGVTVTDTEGCQDSLSYTIFEPDTITFTVDSIVDPLCFNDPARIVLDTAFGGQGTDLLDYSFTVNNDGFLTPFDQAGIGFGDSVVISVFDSVGCFSEQTFQIQQPEEIVIDLPNRVVVELGDTLTQLNPLISPGDRNYTYQWTPPDGLTNDSIRDPFLTQELLRSQEYTLVVTDENGCQAIDDVFVEIDANRNIFIPNAFSPNRDGRNDDFRIYACTGVVGITQVNIFNRWGGLLFEQTNVAANCQDGTILWDGKTPDGREVDTGVYVYTVEVLFIDGVKLLYRGDISVVR